jgi:hypothetical protein
MAEVNKLIVRNQVSEIYQQDKYKVSPTLIDASENTISESLSAIDNSIITLNNLNLNKNTAGLGIDGSIINLTRKDYTPEIGILNTLRNQGGVNASIKESVIYNQIYTSTLLEKIPDNLHISEYLKNLKNINLINEYPMKQSMLRKMARIYGESSQPIPYATNLWMLPLGIETPVTIEAGGKLSSSVDKLISGYIKVLNTVPGIKLNLIMRGVPIPMRKVLTSTNHGEITTYNYVFIYPQYLIDNIELIQAIDHIEINNYTVGSSIYYSNNYYFEIEDAEGYGENLAPLHILNKEYRNIAGGNVKDPSGNVLPEETLSA